MHEFIKEEQRWYVKENALTGSFTREAKKKKRKKASKKDRNTYNESLSLKGAKRHPSLLC